MQNHNLTHPWLNLIRIKGTSLFLILASTIPCCGNNCILEEWVVISVINVQAGYFTQVYYSVKTKTVCERSILYAGPVMFHMAPGLYSQKLHSSTEAVLQNPFVQHADHALLTSKMFRPVSHTCCS